MAGMIDDSSVVEAPDVTRNENEPECSGVRCGTDTQRRDTEELWIKERIAQGRAATFEDGAWPYLQGHEPRQKDQQRQEKIPQATRSSIDQQACVDAVSNLGALQLRRVLKALGQPTDGLKTLLASRIRGMIASGRLAAFVKERRETAGQEFQCVIQARKASALLCLMERLLVASDAARSITASVPSARATRATPATPPSCCARPPLALPADETSSTAAPEACRTPQKPTTAPAASSPPSGTPATPATIPPTPSTATECEDAARSPASEGPSSADRQSPLDPLGASAAASTSPAGRVCGIQSQKQIRASAARLEVKGNASREPNESFQDALVPKAPENLGVTSPRGPSPGPKRETSPGRCRDLSGESCRPSPSAVGKEKCTMNKVQRLAAKFDATAAAAAAAKSSLGRKGQGTSPRKTAWNSFKASKSAEDTSTNGRKDVVKETPSSRPENPALKAMSGPMRIAAPVAPPRAAYSSKKKRRSSSISRWRKSAMSEARKASTGRSSSGSSDSETPPLSGEDGDNFCSGSAGGEVNTRLETRSASEPEGESPLAKPRWGPPSASPLLQKQDAVPSGTCVQDDALIDPSVSSAHEGSGREDKLPPESTPLLSTGRDTMDRSALETPSNSAREGQTPVGSPALVVTTVKVRAGEGNAGPVAPQAKRPASPPVLPSRPRGAASAARPPALPPRNAAPAASLATITDLRSPSSTKNPLLRAKGTPSSSVAPKTTPTSLGVAKLTRSGNTRIGTKTILAGGVGMNRTGVTRAVSPSRLPAAGSEDDDSDYERHDGVVVPPAPAAIAHSTSVMLAQVQAQSLAKKLYKAKDIKVIFHQDDHDQRDGADSDSPGSEAGDEFRIRADSDSGSDEEDDPALKVLEPPTTPEWAMPDAIAVALERQYGGDKPLNPSSIFVDFYTCSLESIFEAKKKKWERKSTGDWMTDRLTIAERLAYDRAMGYVTVGQQFGSSSTPPCVGGLHRDQ